MLHVLLSCDSRVLSFESFPFLCSSDGLSVPVSSAGRRAPTQTRLSLPAPRHHHLAPKQRLVTMAKPGQQSPHPGQGRSEKLLQGEAAAATAAAAVVVAVTPRSKLWPIRKTLVMKPSRKPLLVATLQLVCILASFGKGMKERGDTRAFLSVMKTLLCVSCVGHGCLFLLQPGRSRAPSLRQERLTATLEPSSSAVFVVVFFFFFSVSCWLLVGTACFPPLLFGFAWLQFFVCVCVCLATLLAFVAQLEGDDEGWLGTPSHPSTKRWK